jgi:D-3-phosphoglycerate dehydrogenase / 2-oxoglutarate reductase
MATGAGGADARRTTLVLCQFQEQAMQVLRRDGRVVAYERPEDLPTEQAQVVQRLVVRSTVQVDRELLDRLPNLTHVLRAGSGTDNITLPLLQERGIRLDRYAEASAAAVAELGASALVMLARLVPLAHWSTWRGDYRKDSLWGESLASLDVAIWGAGPVGRATYAELRGRCRTLSFVQHRSRLPGLVFRQPPEVLAAADAHILCLPLRANTRQLFDARMMEAVRSRRPYLVNLGRYELCDFTATLDALERGWLRGIFVDPVDHHHAAAVTAALEQRPPMNLLTSQHLGAQRLDVHMEMVRWILRKLDDEESDSRVVQPVHVGRPATESGF